MKRINIFKTIKLLLALLIFGCLFLPLSQCSSNMAYRQNSAAIDSGASQSDKRISPSLIMASQAPRNLGDAMVLLALVLPLFFCISLKSKVGTITFLLLQTLAALWLIFVTWVVVFAFNKPLWGGYILTMSSLSYFIFTFYEWCTLFKRSPFKKIITL